MNQYATISHMADHFALSAMTAFGVTWTYDD
jgi:hypothetical protein